MQTSSLSRNVLGIVGDEFTVDGLPLAHVSGGPDDDKALALADGDTS
jgi:hypothetical protein